MITYQNVMNSKNAQLSKNTQLTSLAATSMRAHQHLTNTGCTNGLGLQHRALAHRYGAELGLDFAISAPL